MNEHRDKSFTPLNPGSTLYNLNRGLTGSGRTLSRESIRADPLIRAVSKHLFFI